MSMKYRKLTEHLANRDDHEWTARFDEIETILGQQLPDSARQYQAWWSNQNRSQSLGWQLAGWKATALDLDNERVTFVYVGADDRGQPAEQQQRMTIAQAKLALAASFGVDPSQVDITIRG